MSIGPDGGGADPATTGEGVLLKPFVFGAAISVRELLGCGDMADPVGVEECIAVDGAWYAP